MGFEKSVDTKLLILQYVNVLTFFRYFVEGVSMARILVIVPFALVDKGIDNRLNQVQSVKFGPYIDFEFCGPKASGLE